MNFNIKWEGKQGWRALRCTTEEKSQGREVSGRKTGARERNLSSNWFWSGAEPRIEGEKSSQLRGRSLGQLILKGHWSFVEKELGGSSASIFQEPMRGRVGPRALEGPSEG